MQPLYRTCLFLVMLLLSCKNISKSNYTIKDFQKSLQPYLTKIVSIGVVGYDNSTQYIAKHATDEDLIKLSKSEHPVLRAVAFRQMLERSSFNHFDLIMNNLDDTATVATDAGEWGIRYFKVSDDLVQHGKWRDSTAKMKTIVALITKHNYLHSAYRALLNVEPQSAYYTYIREMALREQSSEDDMFALQFGEVEYALFALAKFKKREDITAIRDILLKNCWQMGEVSFRLMEEYPNDTYLDVYEKYYPRNYYRNVCLDQTISNAVYFIKSLATYKNTRSAKILDSILNRQPFMPCPVDTNYCKFKLVEAIRNNPCDAYLKLRSQVKRDIQIHEDNNITLPIDATVVPFDKSAEPVRWKWLRKAANKSICNSMDGSKVISYQSLPDFCSNIHCAIEL